MIVSLDYKKAFFYALGLHFSIMMLLFIDTSTSRPVLTLEHKNTNNASAAPQQEVVKAVAVNPQELSQTVNRLKREKEHQQQVELNKQRQLNHQMQLAREQRIKEQQRLAQLKEEANRIAIARKKQAMEEKKHLKELEEQKAREAKKIEELKQQQELLKQQQALKQQELLKQQEAKKQLELKKKAQAEAKANQLKAEQAYREQLRAKAEQERAEQIKQQQAQQAALQNAAHQAQIASEVDKYKALILNAIGRNWIKPEHVDSNLSSEFQIRLAPDGMVLQVSLTRSSGDPLLDRSAENAIFKASPLPVPKDIETFNMFRDISLTVRPEQVRG